MLSPVMQPKEYASFSSLIWTHDPEYPHVVSWKEYIVWGEGCDAAGLGGRWYTNIYPRQPGWYRNQFDAQAAVESYDLEQNRPEFAMDDVEDLWERLDESQLRYFDQLLMLTGFDELRLSDAIARAYEIPLLEIRIGRRGIGYVRARRAK